VSLRDELQAIRRKRGKLTPEIVVNEARKESHPLHHRFEWNDAIAGAAYRREQAHDLIQSVRISYSHRGHNRDIRAFQAVRLEDGYVYEPSEDIASNPLLREIVLRDMEREWKQMKQRYGQFAEFVEMVLADIAA